MDDFLERTTDLFKPVQEDGGEMKHDWNNPDAQGLQICKRCGAYRGISISGWNRTPAKLRQVRVRILSAGMV